MKESEPESVFSVVRRGLSSPADQLTAVAITLELGNGSLGLLDGSELDDSRSLGAAVLEQNLGLLNGAGRLEELDEILVRG